MTTPASIRLDLQDGPDERIKLGVDENDMLAMLEGVENDTSGSLDGAGDLEEHIDGAASGQHRGIGGNNWNAAGDLLFGLTR